MQRALYVGIDLGTTNSTAAVFDGHQLTVVRNAAGATLTPSVVRMSGKGRISVGEKAFRQLESDPKNTHGGFKRLLGTDTTLLFEAAGASLPPEALSAEVLKSIRLDVMTQCGVMPEKAVITVPALFELPQTRATREAATLAGFTEVELLQEPVASALAAGFRVGSDGTWLVFDLGGGTFDVSLLQGADGVLRVVGHDGDNFLGGRDFDAAIVQWMVQMLEADGVVVRTNDPAHRPFLRRLSALAEEAKIELGRAEEVVITSATPLTLDDEEIEIELHLKRAVLERLVEPLVSRACEVCLRLLEAHDVLREDLDRVVLVGGPTVMPVVRGMVAERVGPLAAEALDPMTLVAQGAALSAAQSGLDVFGPGTALVTPGTPGTSALTAASTNSNAGGGSQALSTSVSPGHTLIVKAPTLSTDLMPFVVARVQQPEVAGAPTSLRLVREGPGGAGADTGEPDFTSEWVDADADGTFALMAELNPRQGNRFTIEARSKDGHRTPVTPSTITIVHGVTIGDPPVSRSIGVALANNAVRVYFEKGMPLPARRTFQHHTVETATPGNPGPVLRIPLVQGEMEEAHLCRLIGTIEIDGKDLTAVLPANSVVEVTLSLDRGGQLSAEATVPALKRTFHEVAHLVVPEASIESLQRGVVDLLTRLARLRAETKARGQATLLPRLDSLLRDHQEAERSLDRAQGGDQEAAQRARRLMLDLEHKVAELEAESRWPELVDQALDDVAWAAGYIAHNGTPAEQKLLDDAIGGLNRARANRSLKDLERHRRVIRRVGNAAFFREPDAWEVVFENYAAQVHDARDLKRAEKLVAEGRRHLEAKDTRALRAVCDQLAELMPVNAAQRARAFASGLR